LEVFQPYYAGSTLTVTLSGLGYSPTFDVSTLTYTNNSLSTLNRTEGVYLDPSGTYLMGIRDSNVNDALRFYTLSTPFDLSTASSISRLFVGGSSVVLKDATFNDTGDTVYYSLKLGHSIYSVLMSDVTNGTNYYVTSGSQSLPATVVGPYMTSSIVNSLGGFDWINNGTQMMLCDETPSGNNDFHIVNASTPYDITTLSSTPTISLHLRGLIPSGSTDGISAVQLIENGHVLMFTLRTTGLIVECIMDTAYDFNNIQYFSQLQHNISGTTTIPLNGVHIGNNKGYFAVGYDNVGTVYNEVYEWS